MIFIKGNVPSSKNSKVATSRGVFHSKAVRKYLQQIGVKNYSVRRHEVDEYKKRCNSFREAVGAYFDQITYPCMLGLHFVRSTKRQFDFHNISQIVLDLLVAHSFIEDDSMTYLIPFPFQIDGRWFTVDKDNPGVYLKIMEDQNGPN